MSAVSIGLILVITPLVLRWLSSGSAPPGVPGTLTYGTKHRVFAVVLALIPTLIIVGVCLAHPPQGRDIAIVFALVGFFMALAAPLILEFFRVQFTFDDAGVTVSSPWSRRRTLRWSDVRVVRWRSVAKWLDLADGAGTVRIHLSPWLTGLERFAAVARSAVSSEVVAQNPEASAVLQLMERGRGGELVWANEAPTALLRR